MSKNTIKSAIQVSVGLTYLIRYLIFRQVNIDTLLTSLDLNPALAKSSDARVPFQTYTALMDQAAHVLGDPYFGLHMGEYLEPAHYGIIGYMMMNSRTIKESYERIWKYMKIIGIPIKYRVQLGLNAAKIIYVIPKNMPKISPHYFDYVIANAITMTRKLTGQNINFHEVGFTHSTPQSRTEYNRVFCSPVKFNQKYNYYVSDYGIDNLPVVQPNPQLLDYFENFAKEYLVEIEGVNKTTSTVIKHIMAHLDTKKLDLNIIAREMCMSVRNLQKRLKREGIIFRDLLKQTRRQLANKYLRDNYSIEEITYLLGYSETSVFTKAFKKWSGYTPKEYRTMRLTQ